MTSEQPKSLDDMTGLLEERARYERWIAQLTEKRDQTPPHVFERVRSDYAARLDNVMAQLRSRAEGVQVTAATLEQQAGVLATEESQVRDVRAEIELRALVGEYSSDRAGTELAACDADIARLEAARSAAVAELTHLQEILTLIRQPDGRPAPGPAPTSRPLGAPATAEPDNTHEELAFLNSVVERREPAPAAAAPAPPAPPAPAPSPRVSDEIPLVTSLEVSDRPEPVAREPLTLREMAGTPSFLKGMPTEQVKTLKCQECGTMNYPTEWYCERCGGELAAM
jgi:hypothetical protein